MGAALKFWPRGTLFFFGAKMLFNSRNFISAPPTSITGTQKTVKKGAAEMFASGLVTFITYIFVFNI